jgi:succinoglycan biosynthesis transport protein ExoP
MNSHDITKPIALIAQHPRSFGESTLSKVQPRTQRGSSSLFSPRVLLRGLRRYWWQAVILWVLGTGGASFLVYKKFKPTYEASSLLKVDLMSADPFGGEAARAFGSDDIILETQVQLVTSTSVLRAAAADPRIANWNLFPPGADPADLLRALLTVKLQPRSYLIKVSLTSNSSWQAAGLVNSVVDAYLRADTERNQEMTRNQIRRLEDLRDELRAQAEDRKQVWLDLAARGNVDPGRPTDEEGTGQGDRAAMPTRMSVTIDEYKDLRGELIRSSIELAQAEAQLQLLNSGTEEVTPTVRLLDDRLQDDRDLGELLNRIATIREQLFALKGKIRNMSDPAVMKHANTLRDLKARYEKLRAAKLEQLRNTPDKAIAHSEEPGAALRAAESRVATLKASKTRIEAMLDQLDVANRHQATDSVKMLLVKAELDQTQLMLDQVNKRLEGLRFASRGSSRSVRIDEATPPAAVGDKRWRILAILPLGTLVMVLGFSTLLEIRSGRVDSPEALSHRIHAEVFAVPLLPAPRISSRSASRSGRHSDRDPVEDFAHRIDHLRVALCDVAIPGRAHCILITSAIGGEGKTTLAAQLAARCAASGASTLLIDADLRRATLGEALGVADSPGLSDVLQGTASVEEALVAPPQLSGGQFLPAGSTEPNPGRALQGSRVRSLFEGLSRSFDVIIVDAPPVLPVPDALTLGRWVDGVILAARHDVSRLHLLEEAQRLLSNVGIPLLGVVVNGVRPSASGRDGLSYSYSSRRVRDSAV